MYQYENKWYEKTDISPLFDVAPEKTIIFDTETTGLDPYKDEILSLAIINGNGEVVFNSLLNPEMRKTWKKASEVNGITPRMVKNSPHFSDVKEEIQKIFHDAKLIIGYNIEFDLRFIKGSGIKISSKTLIFDVMKEYSRARGIINSYYGDYQWCKLEECASDYNYTFEAHDALEDTKATLFCYQALLKDDRYLSAITENKKRAEEKEAQLKREEELRLAEEEKRKQEAINQQEKYAKTEKPMKILRIALLVLGIIWIVAFTLYGLFGAKIGFLLTWIIDVPGIGMILLSEKIKKTRKKRAEEIEQLLSSFTMD